jgi:hypothetical protein
MSNQKQNSDIENIITFTSSLPKMENAFPEPEPLSKNIPEWYKLQLSYIENDKTPENGNQKLTIKKCQAIFDVLSMGYTLKAPCDIYIDTLDGETLKFDVAGKIPPRHPLTGSHAKEQFDKMPIDPDFYVRDLLRLNMIWLIKTQPGHSCLFMNPMLGDSSPLTAVPGVIDTDEFYPTGLFSFFVKKNYKGIVKKGTPLLQVIPFKREDFSHEIIKDTDINNKLDEQMYHIRTVFNSGYKTLFWKNKRYK